MGTPIIDDELWALIEPLLPPPKPRRKRHPGRRPVSDRAALNGILFVFKTGIRWCDLSIKLGFGSGPTCWRRLRDWQKAGLGKFRWVVERTHAWLHNFRRLRIRFERCAGIHEAFLKLGCSLVCWNIFRRTEQSF